MALDLRLPLMLLWRFAAAAALAGLLVQVAAAQSGAPPGASPVPDPARLAQALRRAAAGSAAAGGRLPQTPPLRLRLSPALTEAEPELLAALKQRSDVTLAEPSDYWLNTIADFPQTLFIAQNGFGPPAEGIGYTATGYEELGNLVLADYHDRLNAALRQRRWLQQLMALGPALGAARGTTTCMTFDPSIGEQIECDLGATMATLTGHQNVRLISPSGYAVRNDGPKPRHLYLIDIGPRQEVVVIPLGDGGPVAPGQWAVGGAAPIETNGQHQLITLAAEQPIAAALLDGQSLASAAPADCAAPLAAWLCGLGTGREDDLKGATPPPGWSASASRYQLNTPLTTRIGNGRAAAPKEAPWMAQIYSTVPYTEADFLADDKKPPAERAYLRARQGPGLAHRCGGTLIGDDLVLTAAHCVGKGSFAGAGALQVFTQRRVRMATNDIGRRGTTYAIDGLVIHGGYDPKGHRRDIALLHLKADRGTWASRMISELEILEPGVKPRSQAWLPAELTGFRLDPAAPVKAYGWGFTEKLAAGAANIFLSAGEVQKNPDKLQVGDLQTLDWSSCLKRMGAPFDNKMLCVITGADSARSRPGVTVFSCVGDSGGPLIRTIANREVLVGVTAWSRGCGNPASASVYTDVAAYKDWIAAAVAQIRPGQVLSIDDNLVVSRVAGAGALRP